MQIIMSGLDYNLAPIGLREQLSFTKAQVEALTERIRRDVKGVLGCVLVSTCNRTELYLSCASDSTLCPDQILCHAVKLSHASGQRRRPPSDGGGRRPEIADLG